MEVLIFNHQLEVASKAADLILSAWKRKPNLVLGLAAGRTPLELYRQLIEFFRRGMIDFSQIKVFGLDEFWGVSPHHPLSFAFYFEENFFRHLNISRNNIHLLNGQTENIEEHCQAYETMIQEAGGIDIQILGIGLNGHVGFNEPGSPFTSRTRLQLLAPETILTHRPSFDTRGEIPPSKAITIGLATILKARNIFLLASGEEKAKILQKAIEGPITSSIPASSLQFHPSVFIFLDQAAATCLQRKDLYLQTQKLKAEEYSLRLD